MNEAGAVDKGAENQALIRLAYFLKAYLAYEISQQTFKLVAVFAECLQ